MTLKALNESMLNPGILTNEVNNYISNPDGVVSNDENDGVVSNDENDVNVRQDENDEVTNNDENDEGLSDNKNERVVRNDEGDRGNETNSNVDKDIDGNEKDISEIQETTDDNKQLRKSERIRKQRYEIHRDDIGNNDDGKDKNYKR